MSLTPLWISCKWNLTVFVLLHLAYSTQHHVPDGHPYCNMSEFPSFLTSDSPLVGTDHISCVQSSLHRPSSCVCLPATVNSAAMDFGAQVRVRGPAFNSWGRIPRTELAEPDVQLFEEPQSYFPEWPRHFTFPPAMNKGSRFSTSLPTLLLFWLFF